MDPTPPKVRRMHRTSNHPLAECIRQFKLPQQYPSTVAGHRPFPREHQIRPLKFFKNKTHPKIVTYTAISPKMCLPNRTKNTGTVFQCSEENIVHQIPSQRVLNGTRIAVQKSSHNILSKDMKILPKMSTVSSTSFVVNSESQTKLKTLKLKGINGKELGEFQVEVINQNTDSLKRKFVSVPKQVSSIDESQESDVVSSTQGEPVISYSVRDVQYPGAIYQEPRIIKVGSEGKVKIISDITLNKMTPDPASKSVQIKEKMQNKQDDLFESISNSTIKHPYIKLDSKGVVLSATEKKSMFTVSNGQVNKKIVYLKPEDHPYLKNITQLGKTISLKPLKLKSLNLNKNVNLESDKSLEISNFMGAGGLSGYRNGDIDDELGSEELTTEQFQPVKLSKKTVVIPNGTINNIPIYSGNNSDIGSLQYSDEEELVSSETFETDDSLEQGNMHNNKNTKTEESKVVKKLHRNVENGKRKKENSVQKKAEDESGEQVSPDMSVIERALACVKNKSLRDEALKILASCKLGTDRQIPIRPPLDTLSIRDTTTQTNIFGNLERDREEFIEVKEESKGLKRIKKKMKNNFVDCKSLNTILTQVDDQYSGTKYTSQLDTMLNNLNLDLQNRMEVDQIKDVLNKPIKSNEKIEKVRNQIQKDVKMLTDYDEKGFLGLHKAVMEDNIIAVKRLLLIIKVSKKDIDMKTVDGKTSLELAVKTDAGPDIVKALLDAGANPTSQETGYDSALIIASKNSSPLLPQLIKHANREALNFMDVDGFAAVHHCALRGNMTAINALVAAGANIDLPDCRSGRTALFHAIENQHPETARQLIVTGARANIRNNDGQTILPLLDDVRFQSLKPIIYKSLKW